MATCKECIHYDICLFHITGNEAEFCGHFIHNADVVQVKHGEWIFDFELDGSNFYKCSVCGRQEVLLAKESTEEYFPYCHCGAKMGGKPHAKYQPKRSAVIKNKRRKAKKKRGK